MDTNTVAQTEGEGKRKQTPWPFKINDLLEAVDSFVGKEIALPPPKDLAALDIYTLQLFNPKHPRDHLKLVCALNLGLHLGYRIGAKALTVNLQYTTKGEHHDGPNKTH